MTFVYAIIMATNCVFQCSTANGKEAAERGTAGKTRFHLIATILLLGGLRAWTPHYLSKNAQEHETWSHTVGVLV